ncbi:MAG: hypothetical protein R3E69_04135 [Steroidobacteraceae bacterium]
MGIWVAVVLVSAISAVLFFKMVAKRSIVRGRTPLSLEDIHGTVKDDVSFGVFSEVWAILGKAYSVDPMLLRPTDTFQALGKVDSWALGSGEDAMEDWLRKSGLGAPPQLHTLLEFATWVQSSRASSAASA